MSWGLDLWDQFDVIDKHNQRGIQFFEQYAKYVKERINIETEYAAKLKKLVKSYTPKKKDEDRNVFSCIQAQNDPKILSTFSIFKAFYSQLQELSSIALQRELVAENMMNQIVEPCLKAAQEMKQEKKKLYSQGRQAQAGLENLEKQVENSKKKFEKEWKESERLYANYQRLDDDVNATKADVEKAKNNSMMKKDVVDQCKSDYGSTLCTYNESQKNHYYEEMPQILESYRNSDEKRALEIQKHMKSYGQIEEDIGSIVNGCLNIMKESAEAIDPEMDSGFVVEHYKSGFAIPSDKEFEDYTEPNHKPELQQNNQQKSGRKKGGLFGLFGRAEKHMKTSNSDGNISSNNSTELSPNRTSRSPTRQKDLNRNRSTSCDSGGGGGQSVKSILKDSITANSKKLKTLFTRSSTVSSPKSSSLRENSLNKKSRPKSVGGVLDDEHVYDEIRGDTPKKKPPRSKKLANVAESPDHSHLPPEQRKRKLQTLMDKVQKAIDKEQKEKAGALKMKEVYTGNPSLGDPNSLTGQLNDKDVQINKLTAELQQLEKWYEECTGKSPSRPKSINHNNSDVITKPSITTKPSVTTKPSIPPPPTIAASNVTSQQAPPADNDQQEQPPVDEFDEFEDGNNAIGSCVAIYAYEGVDSAEINLEEGEVYQVLDADGGDGWTRIQDSHDNVGFVPTSYLEIDFYTQY